ncbi:hypothetical protein AB0958_18835 [Streptomyces sp. NPDC006655]|uniref:hypothetical protein n=1 Tax=Streptomyces sp. NPDC006655 TaxID=3156898 RepID=UPI0034546D90
MSPTAARRAARRASHLSLVTVDTTDTATDDEGEPEPRGKHAAPNCPLPIAGSATVRALLALGAVLSAVGLTVGKADAVLSHESQDRPVEAEADMDSTPDTPVTPTTTVVSAPTAPITAAVPRTSPAHWAPAAKPVETHTYIAAPVQGTGKHRKPTTGEHHERMTMRAPGRHRRVDPPGHGCKPQTRGNILPGAVVPLPVSHVI